MLHYSACVIVATNGKKIHWDKKHARWLAEYLIPVERKRVREVEHRKSKILALEFVGGQRIEIDYIFTTRGDIFHTSLAEKLTAKLDSAGQIKVDHRMRTTVKGLYAANRSGSACFGHRIPRKQAPKDRKPRHNILNEAPSARLEDGPGANESPGHQRHREFAAPFE
jgi:hypothetical protein